MKKNFVSFSLVGAALMSVGVLATLASCGPSKPEILIWGSGDHEDIYLAAAQKYAAENEWDVTFAFAGNGDSGAYSNMSIDPQVGAAVYTYANDMLINLNRIGALSPVSGDNLTYIKEHHVRQRPRLQLPHPERGPHGDLSLRLRPDQRRAGYRPGGPEPGVPGHAGAGGGGEDHAAAGPGH